MIPCIFAKKIAEAFARVVAKTSMKGIAAAQNHPSKCEAQSLYWLSRTILCQELKMAVPKKRVSHSRTMMRRSINDRLTAVQVVPCASCGEPKRPHHVCPSCGKYKDQQVLENKD